MHKLQVGFQSNMHTLQTSQATPGYTCAICIPLLRILERCPCTCLHWHKAHANQLVHANGVFAGQCAAAAWMPAGRGRLYCLPAFSRLSQAPESHGWQEQEAQVGSVMCGILERCHTTLNPMACLQGSVLLLRGCWLAGGAYVAWRLSVGSVKRLSHMAGKNRRLKRDLLNVWRGIQVSVWSHCPAVPC